MSNGQGQSGHGVDCEMKGDFGRTLGLHMSQQVRDRAGSASRTLA